jgi:predicted RNase H-like HicB family nuclease
MPIRVKSPMKLLVRCLAERRDTQWQAFSLEFGLAAQGESLNEAKQKLDAMISNYIEDALIGQDRENAHILLKRKAHWSVYARYYFASTMFHFQAFGATLKNRQVFNDALRLTPEHCN